MVKQQTMVSFFKRNSKQSVEQEQPSARATPNSLALVEFVDQRQQQDGDEPEDEDEMEDVDWSQFEEEPKQSQDKEEPVIFRGIEFLQRDPSLRPQVWQYPSNQRDEVRLSYLRLGPMQPNKKKKYRASASRLQGRKRRFQYDYFRSFPSWLEYSVDNHRAYCFHCYLFRTNRKKRSGYDVFTTQGFNTWKKVDDGKNCSFLTHEGSDPCSQHNNAIRDCQALLNHTNHLANILEVKSNEEKEKDRLRLRTTIAVVKWLTFQSCALRGHDERPELRLLLQLEMWFLLANFFQKLLFVINTVDSSSKCHDELHDAQVVEIARLLAIDQIETGQALNQIHSLKRPGETRWGSHLGSIASLMHMFNAVKVVLENLAADSSAGANRADGDTAFTNLSSFEFVFVLCMMSEILETSEDLGKALQKKA